MDRVQSLVDDLLQVTTVQCGREHDTSARRAQPLDVFGCVES